MPECTAEIQVSFYRKGTLRWQADTALPVVCADAVSAGGIM
jgi:hypothetical protein